MTVNLHVATELPSRPDPVWTKRWFMILAVLAGFAFAFLVMSSTDYEPNVQSGPFDVVILP